MKRVEPQVFLVGETAIIPDGLAAYLQYIGVPDWDTDATSDGERLVELMGRLCYKSFLPGLNPNVRKIREGNATYIKNIIKQLHGSVIEHAVVNFIFADVSRVFTHELVRHRVGTATSQESLRFVRLDDLHLWAPTVIRENEEAMEIFAQTFEYLERLQIQLAQIFKLDKEGTPFHIKKLITSAMRRIAPDGLGTAIGWSANFRTLRWLLENRTHPSAEEEIRLVFGKVGEILLKRYPNIFADFTVEIVEGLPFYKPQYSKI